ncbi:AsmA family protein [Dyella tabacisoli]|uniref:AsmA family protein n=1 Tax=Dyella tabacisoli TaxID=2282381 RepID=A0A369UPQ0_9GAMM|nr:AsmA family protein [Dyella tabacisoli]RDD82626.1 AsmA family protein [Dyella tabacisoli]
MSRPLRIALLILTSVVTAAALAAVVAIHLLLQPERFTKMLQAQAHSAGLELNLSSPASPTLFPRPALELQGLTLNARGASMPILLAERGRLTLPWRTLLGGETVISQMEIDSPRMDLDALQAWLSSLPPRPSGQPFDIPSIDTGVRIARGSLVRGNRLLYGDVALEAGCLASGRPFPLTIAAKDANGIPLQLRLTATPRIDGDALQLDNIALHLSQGSSLVLQLAGEARWHGAADATVNLGGKLDHADAGSYNIALTLTPANQNEPLLLALKLDGPDNRADLRLPPLALADWWSQLSSQEGPKLSVPPGSGHIEIGKIETGGISIEGLSVDAGVTAPASAASTATPNKPLAAPKKS